MNTFLKLKFLLILKYPVISTNITTPIFQPIPPIIPKIIVLLKVYPSIIPVFKAR